MWRLIEESTNDADMGNGGGAVASSTPAGEGGGEGGGVEEEGGMGDGEIAAATPAPNFAASFPDAAKVSQVHTRYYSCTLLLFFYCFSTILSAILSSI